MNGSALSVNLALIIVGLVSLYLVLLLLYAVTTAMANR